MATQRAGADVLTEDSGRRADAAYRPFPIFSDWRDSSIDSGRWDRYSKALTESAASSSELYGRALEAVKRAAAIDTGAIEDLYAVDRGFTFSVAFEATIWEAPMRERGEHVRPLFDAQLAAYDQVLDLATKAEPVSEAAIRALHATICAPQATYGVVTAIGPQQQPLPKGAYKSLPNHVMTADGKWHSYAPVDLTPAEMHRLVSQLSDAEFERAHPVLQAAYSHYALACVHPFADGNGRVARALASIFTYRSNRVPLLILYDQRGSYYEALRAADRGDSQAFVDFCFERAVDAMQLVRESLRAAATPSPVDETRSLEALYMTKGGYTQEEVDGAAGELAKAFHEEVTRQASELSSSYVKPKVSMRPGPYRARAGYRLPAGSGLRVVLQMRSSPPAEASVTSQFVLEVPRDCGVQDDLTLREESGADSFEARLSEVRPALSAALQIRLRIFCARKIGEVLATLRERADQALRGG